MEKQLIKWLAENFDISRQENYDTTFVYLHDVTSVTTDMLRHLNNFPEAFNGIELRDNCITIVVKRMKQTFKTFVLKQAMNWN